VFAVWSSRAAQEDGPYVNVVSPPNPRLKPVGGNSSIWNLAVMPSTPSTPNSSALAERVNDSLWIVGWASLRNRRESLEKLEGQKNPITDLGIIGGLWNKSGSGCLAGLEGRYSFVIVDCKLRQAVGVRDTLGLAPLYLWRAAQGFGFVGSVAAARLIPDFDATLDPTWIAVHSAMGFGGQDATAFLSLSPVPSGHFVRFSESGEALHDTCSLSEVPRVWKSRESEEIEIETYKKSLISAISSSIEDSDVVGVELSGGIDSSSIAAIVQSSVVPRQEIYGFGYAIREQEPQLIQTTRDSFPGFRLRVFDSSEMFLGDWEKARSLVWDVLGQPAEHLNTIAHTTIFRQAQLNGCDTLLSGFGGDEAVSSEAFNAHSEAWQQGRWVTAAKLNGRTTLSGIGRYIGKRALRSDTAQTEAWKWTDRHIRLSALSDEALGDLCIPQLVYEAVAIPLSDQSVNDQVLSTIRSPLLWTRPSEGALVAASFGLDYRYPLLDTRLIKTYLASSTSIKRKGSIGRYLHRKAIEELLPSEVVWNLDKTGGSLLSRPAHPLDDLSAKNYVGQIWERMPDGARDLYDRDRMMNLAEKKTNELDLLVSRIALRRIDDLATWMDSKNLTT